MLCTRACNRLSPYREASCVTVIIEVELVEIDAFDKIPERLRFEGGHVGIAKPPEIPRRNRL